MWELLAIKEDDNKILLKNGFLKPKTIRSEKNKEMNCLQNQDQKNIYKMEVEKSIFKIKERNRRWHVVQKVTKRMAHHVNKKLAEWVQGVSTEVGHEMISANEVNIEVNCKLLNEILSCRVKYLEVVNWVSTLSPF